MQITVQGHPIYYDIRGEGTPLVILHGFLLDHEIMIGAFEPLFEDRSGYQRIYVDMPGMGRTPAADYLCSSEAIGDLMVAFINAVIGEQSFLLAGFSYGDYIARRVLKQRQSRVDGLYLIAPAVEFEQGVRHVPESLLVASDPDVATLLPEQLRPMILSTLTVQTRPIIEHIAAEFLQSFPRADQAFVTRLRQLPNYCFDADIDHLATPYDKPSLILTGRHDTSVGYEDAFRLAKGYTRATYVALDRAGHGIWNKMLYLKRSLTNG